MIHYGMTKSAQLSIARGLANLTKGTRVTVNTVMPGPTRSEGIADFLRSVASDPNAPVDEQEAEFFARGRPSSLLQRMIEPEEIANMSHVSCEPAVGRNKRGSVARRRWNNSPPLPERAALHPCGTNGLATTRAGAPSEPTMLIPRNMISTRFPASTVRFVTCSAIRTPWLSSVR